MEWNRDEVHAGTDAPLAQLSDELGPIDLEPLQIKTKNIEVPRVTAARIIGRQLYLVQAGESTVIHPGV